MTTAESMTKGERTKAAFLDAARKVFAEKGYFNTKISDIAATAGKSSGSFYNYYENKEQLLEDLASNFLDEIIFAAMPTTLGNPEESIRIAVSAYWMTYKKYVPELIGMFQMSMTDDSFRLRWLRNRAIGLNAIRVGMERAIAAGFEINLPLDLLASALASTLESFCWTWLVSGGDIDIEAPSDEQAIDVLTAVWYRTAYAVRSTTIPNDEVPQPPGGEQ